MPVQTGVPVLLPTQPGQILFQFGVTLLALLMLIELKPHVHAVDDVLASLVQLSLLLISFISFLFTVEVRAPILGIDLNVLTIALFVILFVPVALVVFQFFLDLGENDGSFDICVRTDRILTFFRDRPRAVPKDFKDGDDDGAEEKQEEPGSNQNAHAVVQVVDESGSSV